MSYYFRVILIYIVQYAITMFNKAQPNNCVNIYTVIYYIIYKYITFGNVNI